MCLSNPTLGLFFLCLWSLLLYPVLGKVYSSPDQIPKSQYDFVIVGSGAAGNVLANRLTENVNFSVLLIEAGVTNEGVTDSIVPFLAPMLLPNTSVTWNYTTAPQSGLNGRTIPYPRGHILGGSTSISFLVWTRGSSDDFNRYSQVIADPGWSWNSLLPYMKKIEMLVPPADSHNTADQIKASIHGTLGPLMISLPGAPTPLDQRVISTTQQLPEEFPFNLDMNSGNTIGVGWTQSSIGHGQRRSSATAYLQPALSCPNLDVLIQVQVMRLVQTGTTDGKPAFNRVELAQSTEGTHFTVEAKKEVILSAGAIGTPQILLLSGIGDSASLSRVGVSPVVNLPDVSQNLQDHALLSNQFFVNNTDTFKAVSCNETLADDLFAEWNTTKQGLFVDGPGNNLGWLRLPQNASIFKQIPDPSAGTASGHYEFIFLDGFVSFVQMTPAMGDYLSLFTNVVSPASRGSVTLASSDPFTFPIIDPGFLSSPFDIFTMVEAIKSALRFLAAPAWTGFVLQPFGDLATAKMDVELEAYARNFTLSVWHPVGMASMSSASAKGGVVDSELLVKGVSGLQVVDASVLGLREEVWAA